MEASKFIALAYCQICLARQALAQFHLGNTAPSELEGIHLSDESLANAQDSLRKVYPSVRELEIITRN
jgi:hypothetical protein